MLVCAFTFVFLDEQKFPEANRNHGAAQSIDTGPRSQFAWWDSRLGPTAGFDQWKSL